MARMSAQERRTSVIRAAMLEFARGGYDGTSTADIARRAGVSQPYLFRLFPGKRAIFLAAATRCVADTAALFAGAARGLTGREALRAMSNAYTRVLVKEPDRLRLQMQVYVAVAAAEAAGDAAFGEAVRAEWLKVWEAVEALLGGADPAGTTTFMAYGMLVNVLVCMGFPAGHPLWSRLPVDAAAGRALPG